MQHLPNPDARTHLDHLGHAVAEFALRQRLQVRGVDKDKRRLVEGADEILALWRVDGRLAADGAVDHGEQRRGHLHVAHAAHERGSDEAAEVADDAAAEGDDDGVARDALRQHPVLQLGLCRAALAALARRDGAREDARGAAGGTQLGVQRIEQRGRMQRGKARVGQQDVGAAGHLLDEHVGDVRGEVEAEMDGGVETADDVDVCARRRAHGRRMVRGRLEAGRHAGREMEVTAGRSERGMAAAGRSAGEAQAQARRRCRAAVAQARPDSPRFPGSARDARAQP
jgi:hypothetical protein